MYQVEVLQPHRGSESVGLDKREWISRLGNDIDTDDLIEPGPVISHRRSAGTAEEVEEPHSPSCG
jgi:hypothetical protein